MRTKIFAAALIASSALAAPAFAQDVAAPFTGPRAEAIVGWDRIEDSESGADRADGVVYGGQVGYDFQAGGAVIGIEGEATGATTRQTENNLLVAGDRYRVSTGRDLYVGGRVGFVVGDQTLVYAKGGYTNAQIKTRYNAGTVNVSSSEEVDGWRLGAGAEFKLNGNMYFKGEYRYSKYEDDNRDINANRHQVVAGVGVRF